MTALPRITIEKLLRDVIPDELALSKETVDWATESATEFLRILGEKANAAAEAATKKEKYRVNAEHVIQALQEMEMSRYLEEVKNSGRYCDEATKQKKQRAASRKALQAASHEELLAEQNALFQQASTKAARQGW